MAEGGSDPPLMEGYGDSGEDHGGCGGNCGNEVVRDKSDEIQRDDKDIQNDNSQQNLQAHDQTNVSEVHSTTNTGDSGEDHGGSGGNCGNEVVRDKSDEIQQDDQDIQNENRQQNLQTHGQSNVSEVHSTTATGDSGEDHGGYGDNYGNKRVVDKSDEIQQDDQDIQNDNSQQNLQAHGQTNVSEVYSPTTTGFTIPLEDVTPEGPCNVDSIKKLSLQLKKDINSLNVYFEKCLPFVKIKNVSMGKQEKLCMEFFVNNKEELDLFRDNAKDKPQNNVSKKLQWFMHDQGYAGLLDFPRNVQFCLHISDELYQTTKTLITQSQNQYFQPANQDLSSSDRSTGTAAYTRPEDRSLMKSFIIYVPQDKHRDLEEVKLCIARKSTKMEHLRFGLYKCDATASDKSRYSYGITYGKKLSFNPTKWFEKTRTFDLEGSNQKEYLDRIWNSDNELQAHLLYRTYQYHHVHHDEKQLSMDIESACKKRKIQQHINTFVNGILDLLFEHELPFFVVAIIIGNLAYDQIDSVRMNMDRHATTVIAELSPLTLDKFSTSCRGYMPDVCHKLFRIAKAHKFSYVSEIKYFSKFLGNLKFQCLGKCVEQHVLMVTKSDSKEEFHNIYNELVELYIQNNCKDYLIYIQNLLKYSPVSFCVSAMISRQTENLGKETVVKVTKQGICENVGILSAIRNYDIQKLYSFWNEVCRFETARHHFKRVFEKHIMDLLDKVSVSDVSTSTMSKLFAQSDGLFEDNTSQENLLKTLVTRSTSQMTLSLFTDLYSTKKFGHMYSSISLEIFISWLDKSKKCWSDDKKLCTKFVDVLKITADRKDVQSQVFGHFIGIKSSSAFELVSFWREHRDCFKSYPPAEDVFIHHIKEALLKDTKCKPLKILEKLKNSHQILNVDSRSTAVIVSSILDAFCSLKATGSVQDLFKPIMKHIEIWEIVVTGRGDYIHIVHAGNVCQSALAFFSVLAESLIKRKLSYNFCETIMQSKQHDIHVLNQILIKHKAPDMSTVWGKIKGIYEDEMTKLKCVHDVLKRTFDHIKAETLPEKFYDILNDQEKELRDKDLSDDGISDLWHGKCALADYCIKLNILTQSRLFWNVNVETISTLHAKYKPFKEYLDYDRVCDFLESVFKIGQEEYITTLDEIENSPTLNVAKIKVIFKNATDVERLEIERDLAKQVLKSNTCEEPFEVLKRLTEIDTVSNDIRAIKSAVMAFGLHNEESQHNMLIDEDFFKRKDFDSLTFKELKKQLQNLFKLKADSSEILFEILNQIGSSKALISFLKEIVEEDIRNLTDAVDDISEQYVQASTVASLIEIKTFLQPLLTEKFEHTSAFICAIKTRIKRYGDKADDIPLKINTCIGSLHQLRALYKNVANRGEQTKETIQKILSEGSFNVYLNETTHKVDVTCSCKSNQSVYTELTLVDLRSRALLLMNSERGKGDKTCSNEHFARFVQYIDQSLEIKLLVKGLYLAGHTGYEKFEMSKDGEKLIDEKLELVKKLQIWEERLRKQRETFYLLNFLQSVQLHTFFRYMTTGEGLQQVEMMLKFIHPKFPLAEWKACSRLDESKAGSELEELGMSLIQTIKKDLFEEERVLREQSIMKNVRETVQKGKMSIVRLEETSVFVVKTVLALYENTTDSFPEPHQVLFCSKDTEWDEIQILLNRCIFSRNYHERDLLYCLANVELLPNEMQFRLVDSLRGLQSSAQYLLCVVFRGSLNHLFFEEFAEHVTPIQPWSTKKTEDIFRKKYSETLTISSEIAGLGKTTRIKRLARTKKQGVLSLHISGTVLKKVLVQQLNQLNLKPYHALHLDVASVDDVISLDTFLFELLFLRYVTTGTESFSLKNECIYLEIANTINDTLRNSLQTAMCFRREHLVWNDFQDFVVSLEINSPVKVVCAYFDKLEIGEMDKADILLTNEHVPLPSTRCRSLLVKYIQLDEEMSFVVVNSLLKVLADQLKKMSCSSFFKTERLQDVTGGKNEIKSNLVNTLTAASKENSIRSIQSCKKGQVRTMTSEDTPCMLQGENMIRWEDSNHLIYVFYSQNIQTISAMYREVSKVPAEIKSLFEGQMKRNNEDFRSMCQDQLQSILQKVSRTNPLDILPNRLNELAKDYALTPDNLLKMVLIVMRIRARVPVVMMGETGCGKTSLIQFLANICEIEFDVLNIHAGTELSQIVLKLEENNEKAMSCLMKERWVFLDEINTSENISVISDVICHHQLAGKKLSPNLVILSACNPYKKRSTAAICTAGMKGKVKPDEMSKLVYRVLPLPQQLVDYVWDFGSLSNKDENLYIRRMTHDLFKENKQLLDVFVDLLTMSQEFVRSTETNCNVSLRDVQRCRTLAQWFSNKLKEKELDYKKEYNPDLRAVIMAIAHCYYSRLVSHNIRHDFLQKMAEVFEIHDKSINSNDIKQVIILEQRDILERMELPLGTALNQSLQENVFMILVCILNKIPIFVVGKPGCSKSLAMQVIRSNLRGKDSKDEFFKTLPQLYCVSFQGSESSTSEGIIKVFEKAENFQNSNSEDVLSVVIIDEIGLAEVSRFNPLKVLHSLLEPGGKPYPNVAVVGMSNWALDASRMNRAIHLSRPDMDSEELFETGKSISRSFEHLEVKRKNLFHDPQSNFSIGSIEDDLQYMANAYYNYCAKISFENFHGLRDYYALVKYVVKEYFASNESLSIYDFIKKGLERNFGGLPAEKRKLYESFKKCLEISEVQRKVIDIIEENITDHSARHLMLITSGHSALGILQQKLDKIGRKRHEVIIGSQFEEDLTDDYNYRLLSRIILCMEEGIVLILKDLDTIYGSLYDMLNQNYTVIGKTKNCRVSLGHYSNQLCRVAESFRCIVLIDNSKLNYQDPPFINRFEKQILCANDIISRNQRKLIKYIDDWIKKLGNVGDECFNEQHIITIFSEDLFESLVLKLETDNVQNAEENVRRCKSELVGIMKSDAVLRLSNVTDSDMSDEADAIKQLYFDMPLHGGLLEFYEWDRQNCGKENRLRIIFTFTSVNSNAICLLKGEKGDEIQTENIGSFKSEKQLSSRIEHFWFQSRASLLCLQCSVREDGKHVSLVMSVVERFSTEFLGTQVHGNKVNKHVYLILHIGRILKSSVVTHINFLSNWKLTTLDSIEKPKVKLPEMCKHTLIDTIKAKRPLYNQIADQLFWAFTRIKYSDSGRSIQSIQKLLEKIKSCDRFFEIIDNYLWKTILRSNNDRKTDWQVQVAFDKQLLGSSSGMIDAFEMFLQNQIQAPLAKIICHLEVHGVLDTFLIEDIATYGRRKLWENFLIDEHVFDISCVPQESGPECYECLTPDLSFRTPFFKHIYDSVEESRTDFLQTISLLKERLELEDKELTDELTNDVIRDQQNTVVMILPKVDPMYENLSYDYFEDFCNVLSYSCVGFTHKDRINITRHLVLQKANIDFEDFFDVVIKLHSLVWMNAFLLPLKLRILGIYSEVFKLQLSDFQQTCDQVGGRLPETINTETNRNHTTTDQDEGEGEQERNLNIDFSNEINFVRDICKNMLPCHKIVDVFADIRGWSNTAGRILPLVSVISNDPVELDMLRFCYMIYEHLILPLGLADNFLFELADGFLKCGEFKNEQVFHCVLRVFEAANGKSPIACQRVFADYMMKGLVIDPSDDSLCYLYSLIIDSTLPDANCSLLKEVIYSSINFQIEVNDDKDILQMLLKAHNSMDSPGLLSLDFFKHMESCLMKLSKQNRHHDPFVVLLIDSLEEMFLARFKKSKERDVSSLFLTAHATIQQGIFSVTYLASLGCYKAFMKSAIKDGEVKKEYCHVLNTIFTHGPLNKTFPFFNVLRGRLSSHRFCKKIAQLKSKLPNLKIELSFTSSKMCLDNCPFGLKVANVFQSKEEDNYLKLLKNVTTVDDLLKVYDVLFREYYIPQGFQVLNDNQNHNAYLLANEIKNHKTLDRPHGNFMMCLLGRSDFKIKQFMLSPETTSRQYLINITLTLLFSMLFCYKTNEPFSLLQTCLINPVELKEMFLPGCKTSTKRQTYGLSENDLMLFTSCLCGTRICLKSFDENTTCIACGSFLKIKEEARLSDSTIEPKGLLLIEQMKQWDYEQKSLSSVACNLLFFFMKGCLLGSYAIGVSDGPTLEKVVGVPEIDIEEYLSQHLSLDCHWQNLLRLLNLEDYHLFLFIHSFIFNNETFLCLNHDSLRSFEDRNKWEVNFSEAVESMVINRFELIKRQSAQARTNHCADTDQDEFEACIGEMNELDQNSELTFFRMSTSASVGNFWAELSCTSEFPFLKLLTQREKEINRVSSIFAIIQWHSTLVSRISYMFKSYDIFEKTVREVVQHEHCTKHRTVLEKRFNALCTAWHNSCINHRYETINWESKMSKCIILDNQSQLFQGLNFLAGIQNNIIQLAMGMSVGKSNLGLFAKSTKGQLGWQVAVPEVKVIEIKREMLISLEGSIKDKILKASQCDHRYGYGRRVVYDFYEIERSLVSSVLVGKVFIKTDIHLLPKVNFSDYLFKNVALLLSEVKRNIKQENISPDMERHIQNKHKENPKMVPQLLIYIGMMLSLLKRTKGDSEETVEEYVNKMKNLLPSDSVELPCENLKLCHIVGFYELLEELHADSVVGGLSDKYRLRIESDDKKYFKQMAEERYVLSEVLLKTLKKFIHRCLDKRETEDEHTEAGIGRPLRHYLSDLSLWPDQYLSQGDIVDGEAKLNVVNLIPEAVTIGHIHELVALLREITQPNEKVNKYVASAPSQRSLTPEERAKKKLHSLRK